MAKAKYFTQNNEKVYPISHTKAVYDGKGKVLEDRLTEDEAAISSLQTDVKGKANKTDVDNKLNSNSAISDTTVAFTEASVRENIVSNEKSSTLFGKVQKWFSDLKKVAFTGSYNDLIDTPSNATTTINGLMSSSDKIKLNGISSNANNYIHPTTSGNKHIPSGGSSGQILKWSADGTAIWGTEKTYSNATTSSSGLMSASDKTDLDACVETLSADASMFLSSIKSPAPAEFEFVETLSLSNLTLTGDVVFSDTGLFNGYASLTEITSGLNDIFQKNIDNGFDFVYYMVHNTSSKRFEFSATDPLYISSSQGGKWYYDGNEIATKSDIPSTSDFLKTSGGTLSGNTTLTSGYGFLSSYSSNLKLLRVNSSSNYFGEQGGATAMYNYFGYRNSANTTTIINHFGSSYNPSYAKNIMNYYGRFAETNHFGANAINSYFGSSSTTSYYRGDTIYLGDSTSHPVYMQGSTSYKVVGTTTGHNTKVHVVSSQPSNMSVGDIWFKIPS
ncbi:MAG: hypothetical protein ACLVBD_06290 [Hominilimicola sp.]|uniref:hypothetical protein n=1 Tax=Hominilimicola sp. TaxID=3073571 RepID=UPI00399A865D